MKKQYKSLLQYTYWILVVLSLGVFCESAYSADLRVISGKNFVIITHKKKDIKVKEGMKYQVWRGYILENRDARRKAIYRIDCTTRQELRPNSKKPVVDDCPTVDNPPLGDQVSLPTGNETRVEQGQLETTIPRRISPRYSLLRSKSPTFFWEEVPDSDAYSLTLYRVEREELVVVCSKVIPRKNIISQDNIASTKNFICDEEKLEAETAYKLTVSTACPPLLKHLPWQCVSSEQEKFDSYRYIPKLNIQFPVSELNFELINPTTERLILKEDLSRFSDIFIRSVDIAGIYKSRALYSEGIEILRRFVMSNDISNIDKVDAYDELRILYEKLGLENLAQQAGVKADNLRKSF
jgi:hypothetical protein